MFEKDRPVRLFTHEGRIVSGDGQSKHIHSRARRWRRHVDEAV